jgi:hypothetical protein
MNGFTVSVVQKLRLGKTDYNFEKFKSAKSSICILNHIKKLNVCGYEESINNVYRAIFVNDTPLYKIIRWIKLTVSQMLPKSIH